MTTQLSEARELCSKSELELIESSFSPMIDTLPRSGLKSRLERARKLHRKSTDLVSLQHSESRKSTTRRKTEMFAEAVGRFEATLNRMENAGGVEASPKDTHSIKVEEETRLLNRGALRERADREVESLKSHVRSAMAVQGEQQGQKSGARRIQSHVGSANRRQQGRRDTKNG